MSGLALKTILMSAPVSPRIGGNDVGGIANHVAELALHLERKGYEIILVGDNDPKMIRNGRIHIWKSKYQVVVMFFIASFFYLRHFAAINKLRCLSLPAKLRLGFRAFIYQRIMVRHQVDVIHIHSLVNGDVFLKIFFPDIKFVITDHGFINAFPAKSKLLLPRLKKATRLADAVVAISHFSAVNLEKYDLVIADQIDRINNPVDLEGITFNPDQARLKKEFDIPADRLIIFFNGYRDSVTRKGFDLLLAAFANSDFLTEKCFLIAIVNAEGRELAGKLFPNAANIKLMGATDWETVGKLYNLADLLVTPSRSEGFGLVYLEALAAGCPIIGFQPTFTQFETDLGCFIGYPFDANLETVAALVDKIRRLTEKLPQIDKWSLRRRVAEAYSWEVMIQKFIDLYQKGI